MMAIPQDHLLRLIDKAIDWSSIYDFVEGRFCNDPPSVGSNDGDGHDSRTFKPLYDKIRRYAPRMVSIDAGY